MKLRIALDCDDTLFDWRSAHEKKFNCVISKSTEPMITAQVHKCKFDRDFWVNLRLLERPNFVPYIYCTKRINPTQYTIECIKKNHLPLRPIYQVYKFEDNKADFIRTICDVLIDDSYYNVMQCIESGFPALLITREHNKGIGTPYRVDHLNYKEILNKYNVLFR